MFNACRFAPFPRLVTVTIAACYLIACDRIAAFAPIVQIYTSRAESSRFIPS